MPAIAAKELVSPCPDRRTGTPSARACLAIARFRAKAGSAKRSPACGKPPSERPLPSISCTGVPKTPWGPDSREVFVEALGSCRWPRDGECLHERVASGPPKQATVYSSRCHEADRHVAEQLPVCSLAEKLTASADGVLLGDLWRLARRHEGSQ